MRFGSTAKVLLKCKLKYYRISECHGVHCQCRAATRSEDLPGRCSNIGIVAGGGPSDELGGHGVHGRHPGRPQAVIGLPAQDPVLEEVLVEGVPPAAHCQGTCHAVPRGGAPQCWQ